MSRRGSPTSRTGLPARPSARFLGAALALLLAACGTSEEDGAPSGCTITYSGGASETVWCDPPVVRTNGSGGYVLWVMAFRGAPSDMDQAGQARLTMNVRPQVAVDYGFADGAVDATVDGGFMVRTAASVDTHEAVSGSVGAFNVRFSSIPTSDGADPGGLDGIGTVHGTFTATLVPIAAGTDVTVSGSF